MPSVLEHDFDTQTQPYRRELVVHCYRLLGSAHEAEDLVQDTMLRAWRARERYDAERASVRTWLYRIATNVCLTALEGRPRRPLPSGLGGPSDDPDTPLVPAFEIPWLQPLPGAVPAPLDPAERAMRRGSVRLALIAALQTLPARQRAVLVLRDVLDFPAAEVAGMLSSTTASVNSALQRARATLARSTPIEEHIREPDDDAIRQTVERYIQAFEAADVEALVALLTADAVLEMPPVPLWFLGREDYGRFLARVFALRGPHWRMTTTWANEQPAVAAYCRGDGGQYVLHTLQVFTVTPAGISRNVVFQDPAVFAAFELEPVLAN